MDDVLIWLREFKLYSETFWQGFQRVRIKKYTKDLD